MKLAQLIAYIFHPVFMPLLAIILLLQPRVSTNIYFHQQSANYIYLWIFVITCIFPLISIYILLKSGIISSLEMNDKKERKIPYIVMLVYLTLTYFMLRRAELPTEIFSLFTGIILSIIATVLINISWKISAHMVAIGGVTGGIFAYSSYYIYPLHTTVITLIVLSGIVGTSRLIVGKHSSLQIYTGYVMGFVTLFSCIKQEFYI